MGTRLSSLFLGLTLTACALLIAGCPKPTPKQHTFQMKHLDPEMIKIATADPGWPEPGSIKAYA